MKPIGRIILHLVALLSVKVVTLSLLFLVCLSVTYSIVHDVFTDSDTGFDTRLFAFAEQLASPGMTRFMRYITYLGSEQYLIILPALFILIFSFYKDMRWHSLRVLLISFVSSILNQLLKLYFERPRPPIALLDATGLSFPSGHAMIGGVFHGLLIYIVFTTVQNKLWRWLLCVLLSLIVLLVGFSRIYLKVHYATDVVAGYLMGLIWLMASLYLLSGIEKFYIARYQPTSKI
ncbi:phosphatase PAP2 family protein [Pontibacter fetidus]|uniref:Phosphatase PAP2 family protein n=1 Tax=Pontibacter fetidus TaxID=2700082 RepID=A0A6B2H0K2_9BACT|nr:phosphatase PAP2 family protein [Pontibacter fetidus]NDK55648.1 phosphatase PAP2 family protein [Pontibacter fetidus]